MTFPTGVRARVRSCASRRGSWGANMNEGVRRVSRLKVNAKDKKMKVMEEIERADWLHLVVLHEALGLVEDLAIEVFDEDEDRDGIAVLTAKADRAIARRMVALRGHVGWAHDAPDLGPVIDREIRKLVKRTAERLWEEGDFS